MTIVQKIRGLSRRLRRRLRDWLCKKIDFDEQRKLINAALSEADDDRLLSALDGSVSDAQAFAWATLDQVERYLELRPMSLSASDTPRDLGAKTTSQLEILTLADAAVDHVKVVEKLRRRLDRKAKGLRPTEELRRSINEARNLLVAHRDERVLYRRLTGQHTPRVIKAYKRIEVEISEIGIDVTRRLDDGTLKVGDILSVDELVEQFKELETQLEEIRTHM